MQPMMNNIKQLDQKLINKIAAGEVVERPANIVKELIENAIDAHADSISIYIEGAGMRSIHIIDNGTGIAKEELMLATTQHATSKISTEEDLENIHTLGFRGEALSSISAVSKLEIISKTADEEHAYKITVHGGEYFPIEPASFAQGTSLKVTDLFYNTPARRKFVKSEQTEYSYIQDIITAFILANPTIQFRIYNNGKEVGNYVAEKTSEQRVKKLLNISQSDLIPLSSDGILKISGYIGKAEVARNTRDKEYLFVNNRYIQNSLIAKAISEGYPNLLMTKRYPVFVVFITLPSSLVDVNVHPRKTEVRFANSNEVFSSVKHAVQAAFQPVSLMSHTFADTIEAPLIPQESLSIDDTFPEMRSNTSSQNTHPSSTTSSSNNDPFNRTNDTKKALEFTAQILEPLSPVKQATHPKAVQYLNRYIITELDNVITIIDQHAAAEMVLFEEYLTKLKEECIDTQSFLVPVGISLAPKDIQLLEQSFSLLSMYGIDLSLSGNDEISVQALPFSMQITQVEAFISELLDILRETGESSEEHVSTTFRKKIAASLACHSAIRFGDSLTQSEVDTIVRDLQQCREYTTCPHGRPIIYTLSLGDLDKIFKRK